MVTLYDNLGTVFKAVESIEQITKWVKSFDLPEMDSEHVVIIRSCLNALLWRIDKLRDALPKEQ